MLRVHVMLTVISGSKNCKIFEPLSAWRSLNTMASSWLTVAANVSWFAHTLLLSLHPYRRLLTSFLSWRHSSTARLLFQECLGQSRVRSSLHTASSANFQPVVRLRGSEAPRAWFLSAAPAFTTAGPAPPSWFCWLSVLAPCLPTTLLSPRFGFTSAERTTRSRRRGTRIQSAIFTEPVSLLLRSGEIGHLAVAVKLHSLLFLWAD